MLDEFEISQPDIVAFLKAPGSLSPGAPEVIETHCAMVFLTDDTAYKLKRAVKYDYLDYSTAGLRRKMLVHELRLNKPTAPDIYHDVIPITRDASGHLAIDGSGRPVDWLLRMARFPAENELDQIAKRGEFDDRLAKELGQSIASYHDSAPKSDADGAELISEILDELNLAFAGMEVELGPDRIKAFKTKSVAQFDVVSTLLTRRGKKGWVRRCHGDLHLRNVVMIDGIPTPFDGLEFDERLGTCDVLYDLAFLLMDLRHRELEPQANRVLNGYRDTASRFDLDGLRALQLFLSVRAAIRAMVLLQMNRLDPTNEARLNEGRHYMDQALEYLIPPPAKLLAIGGLSGTGKTTIARALAHKLGPPPGAIDMRSDIVRKKMFGVDPITPLPPAAYEEAVTRQVYATLHTDASTCLKAGHSVVLDATHLSEAERSETENVAERAGTSFIGIWLEGDMGTLVRRVQQRPKGASDADEDVLRKLATRETGPIQWHVVNTTGSLEYTLAKIGRILD